MIRPLGIDYWLCPGRLEPKMTRIPFSGVFAAVPDSHLPITLDWWFVPLQ